MATKKYVSIEKLGLYDEKIKKYLGDADTVVLDSAKKYTDDSIALCDVAGAAATAKSEAIAAAKTETETQVKALADGQVKTNKEAIEAIRDDANIDSFADVVAALATKQDTGDYATKSEAKGYADSKDDAIAAAKAAGDAAQGTANANAQAIEAINNAETGILATAKGYTDTEVAKVQGAVDTLAGKVGTVPEGKTVMGIIDQIQQDAYDDTEIQEKIDGVDGKVTTLVGSDTGKSVRAIAAEELAAQLVADGAAESLDTLEEIAAWIQSHPGDAAEMNEAIVALQNKVDTGDQTVSAYVTAAINALKIGDYAKAADLTALAGRVEVLEGAVATKAEKTYVDEQVQALQGVDTGLDNRLKAVEAKFGDGDGSVADQIADVKTELQEEIATAIDGAKTDASNKDAVVLAEAQKAATAVQTALDTHTGNGDIHVTTDDKAKWNAALQTSDITTGSANGTVAVKGTDVAVKGLGSAAYVATTTFDASGSAAQALTDAKGYTDEAIAQFVECSQEDINNLFA